MDIRRLAAGAVATIGVVAGAIAITGGGGSADHSAHAQSPTAGSVQTLTYYVGIDEVMWDYAPQGRNLITGEAFGDEENVFVQRTPTTIGSVYKKALYREYTDGTFNRLKERPAKWQHLGLLGPVIRAEVGDTIRVVLRNNASRPYSLHPHGVFYDKGSEGAPYSDGTSGAAAKGDDEVAPGATRTYIWKVPPRAGPGPHDGNSVMWMYHGHVDEPADQNAGLMGAMIINADGQSRADGTPLGIDREQVAVYSVMDENASHYLQDNIDALDDPAGVDPDSDGFVESNLMHAINGFVYGNEPGGPNTDQSLFKMRRGEKVRT
jgi:manganese oxidase